MEKKKSYNYMKFSGQSISAACKMLTNANSIVDVKPHDNYISKGDERWTYDTLEEFLLNYPDAKNYYLSIYHHVGNSVNNLRISGDAYSCSISIGMKSKDEIEKIFKMIEDDKNAINIDKSIKFSLTKTRVYNEIKFPSEVIESACMRFNDIQTQGKNIVQFVSHVDFAEEKWEYSNIRDFLADYNDALGYGLTLFSDQYRMTIRGDNTKTVIEVIYNKKTEIQTIFNIFENNLSKNILQVKKQLITIFIGHGHDPQWKDLKDYLHEKHDLRVEAYEIGARAGFTVKEVLESMLSKSSMAFLVFSGEDEDISGNVHARENVVHELGLFQGRLGFHRAIVLLKEGVTQFSNIRDINQIRFKDTIRETFGDVIATIRREFTSNEI